MNDRKTIFSPDRNYRYTLWRFFEESYPPQEYSPTKHRNGYVMFIGLNPSTADEVKDDPTIRKCVGFAKRWGYRELVMTNLFAYRATKPQDMKNAVNPVGEENQHYLLQCASKAAIVVAAWGKHGKFGHQDLTVNQWLSDVNVPLFCLRRNKDGSPMHPLYVPYETQLQGWLPS